MSRPASGDEEILSKAREAITTAQTDGNSDANIASGISPAVVINTAGSGMDKDNMTIDAGYHACGSAGNYVWIDLNGNGLNDETASSGMNGVTVELWKETSPELIK